jgi:hypothetical protein
VKTFFVSYNKADRQWAEWIAWKLEEAGYTAFIQAWDIRPGSNFVVAMQGATEKTDRTVVVLSPDFLQAEFTQAEWSAAFVQDPTGKLGILVPVRVREVDLRGMWKTIVYIDLVGLTQEDAKQVLLSGIASGRAKPTTVPPFPAHATRATPPATVEPKYPVSEPINRDPFANWSVFDAASTADGGLAYLYRSESTRVTQIDEFRLDADQRRFIDALLYNAQISIVPGVFRVLFKFLIPNHLKELLAQASRLCLVVDEYTARYPWELLSDPSQDPAAPSFAVRSELIRRLVRCTAYEERVRDTTSTNVYVVGDPLTPPNYPELHGARKEADLVASLLKPHYTVNHSSQRLGALEVMNQLFAQPYRIIHIAGHGYYSEPDIETIGAKAGVVLDGGLFLTAVEIAMLDPIPELVFLSCGYLGQIGGTAYNKMAASISCELIMKGVRAVVAAGWPVWDDAAICFAQTFYKQLLEYQPFGRALQKAREQTWTMFPQSNTWGAYQAYGDPDFSLTEPAAKDRRQTGDEPPVSNPALKKVKRKRRAP